jgi:hypothetical protein
MDMMIRNCNRKPSLVREDTGDHLAITVLFDGTCDGGPLEYLVAR